VLIEMKKRGANLPRHYRQAFDYWVRLVPRRTRRVGEFDWVLLRKAASLNAPTDIALTFADYLNVKNRKARRFE
jgi:hypothetical protein